MLNPDEIHELTRFRDWRSWQSIATNWGVIGAAFALVAWRPNPLTIVLALFLIGGRQLGMAVLMHEAAHRTLFSHRGTNDWAANWLCAFPIWSDLRPYRPYHLQHHMKTWTEEDPDVGLAMPFPVTRESFRRKVWRDLSGQTGYKRAKATMRRDLGRSRGRVQRNFEADRDSLHGVLLTNGLLLAVLWAAGHPALYLLWVGAWLTSYSLVMRIRSIAEHGMTSDPTDDFQNTRTMLVSLWERVFVAPNFVNYHLEHHLLIGVPHYNLPRMHQMLRDKGLLETANVVRGYRAVLQLASSRVA